MNMAIVSLVALLAAIVIGFILKVNVGIISIAFAYIIGMAYGISASDIISGFSSSMAVTLIGVMYIFSIITTNGTLEVLAKKICGLVGKRKYLLYVAMYIIGVILCGIGPGAIPTLAIIPVLAIPVALRAGMNPILLSLIGQMGVQSARMCPITPEAVVVAGLMEEQGLSGSTVPAMLCLIVTEIVLIAATFIYMKGWKFDDAITSIQEENQNFNSKQVISLFGLLAVILAVVILDCNVGLAGFVVGTILIILKCGNDGPVIKSLPWGTIMLVLGVGTLMNVVKLAGGVDLLSSLITSVSNDTTASPLMCFVAGIMSFFASGLGVVFPTLIPTVGSVAAGLTATTAAELMSTVVIGGTVTGFSPISTAGALIMSGVSQFKEVENKYTQNRMFIDLFAVAIFAMIISVVLALTGVYGLICGAFV